MTVSIEWFFPDKPTERSYLVWSDSTSDYWNPPHDNEQINKVTKELLLQEIYDYLTSSGEIVELYSESSGLSTFITGRRRKFGWLFFWR
jgi:hypothetical protein